MYNATIHPSVRDLVLKIGRSLRRRRRRRWPYHTRFITPLTPYTTKIVAHTHRLIVASAAGWKETLTTRLIELESRRYIGGSPPDTIYIFKRMSKLYIHTIYIGYERHWIWSTVGVLVVVTRSPGQWMAIQPFPFSIPSSANVALHLKSFTRHNILMKARLLWSPVFSFLQKTNPFSLKQPYPLKNKNKKTRLYYSS